MKAFKKYYSKPGEINVHNKEVKELWDSFNNGRPFRVPVMYGEFTPQMLIHYNDDYSFKDYYFNPETHINLRAESTYLNNKIITSDKIMKMPDKWPTVLDYWCVVDEGYMGCKAHFSDRFQPKFEHTYEGNGKIQ